MPKRPVEPYKCSLCNRSGGPALLTPPASIAPSMSTEQAGASAKMQAKNANMYDCQLQYHGLAHQVKIFADEPLRHTGHFVTYRGEMVGADGGGSLVAVKVITILSGNTRQRFATEVQRWIQLEHANVHPFYGVTGNLGINQVGLVTPFAVNGNMSDFILQNPTIDRLALLIEVAQGLQYLHRVAAIVHGDLKCSNVLIDTHGRPRICDSGLSNLMSINKSRGTVTATLIRLLKDVAFMAPELLSDSAFQPPGDSTEETGRLVSRLCSKTTRTDVYAFGGMVYEAFAGEPPWSMYANFEVFDMANTIKLHILHNERPPRTGTNPGAIAPSDALWGLCEDCWDTQPSKRPTCDEILERLVAIDKAESQAAAPT